MAGSAKAVIAGLSMLVLASATAWRTAAQSESAQAPVAPVNPVDSVVDVQPVNDLPNPFRAVDDWAKLPQGRKLGSMSGIAVDRDGQSIWIVDRCGGSTCASSRLAPVMKFDSSGQLIRSFGAGMFVVPHGITVDRGGNVWVVDASDGMNRTPGKGHQVVEFSPDGKVLLTLGKAGVAGDGRDTFNRPSAVAIAANGDIFVADGHGGNSNARIVKFAKDGSFIKSWGHKGSGSGDFDTPHSLALDLRGRLFVADAGNNRIQIFDLDGTWLAEWQQFGRPQGLFIDPTDWLYVADSGSNAQTHPGWTRGIRIGSARDGEVESFIPDSTPDAVPVTAAEGIAVDAFGKLYTVAVGAPKLLQYVRK